MWYSNEFIKWNDKGRPINEKVNELYISNSNNETLGNLENLVNLKMLYCGDNQLTSLEGIENLNSLLFLTHLYCCNNQLTSLEGIEKIINLIKNNIKIVNNIEYDFMILLN
jgi:Leucine-rich repeat (LRR) protein